MLLDFDITDIAVCLKTVLALSHHESELSQIAIAHVIRNRLAVRPETSQISEVCADVLRFDRNTKSEPLVQNLCFNDESRYWRALALICNVWSLDYDDPTQGATRFHRHDVTPDWAKGLDANALIESRLYYVFDE